MTAVSEAPASLSTLPGQTTRRTLPDGVAFVLLASTIVAFLACSSVPTPLYAVYQAEWGFSPITITVVFGVYALAVLAALLTVGRLSDHIGRRPVLAVAIAVQSLTMLVFAGANGVPELMAARILQGLATGAAAGAASAALIDFNKARGAVTTAFSGPLGTALGALTAGLFVVYLPAPTHLIYVVLAVIFAVQVVGVLAMRETSAAIPGALASMRPDVRVPRAARGALLVAAPALVAAWAMAGFYGSLGPSLLRIITGSHSPIMGGFAMFVLAGSGAAAVLLLRNWQPARVLAFGAAALLVGTAITVVAIDQTSTAIFFVGAVIAGAGFGAGFQGSIRSVVSLAQPHERAGVMSVIFVVSYVAMGVPAVIAGFLVVHDGGLAAVARYYAYAVMVCAALALVGMWRSRLPRT
jgi:MFS family permease